MEFSFDRYRKGLKGTWKDKPLPGAGCLYDLGAHLIDQALTLFGRPQAITAFIQNLRGIGNPEVDDSVSILPWVSWLLILTQTSRNSSLYNWLMAAMRLVPTP